MTADSSGQEEVTLDIGDAATRRFTKGRAKPKNLQEKTEAVGPSKANPAFSRAVRSHRTSGYLCDFLPVELDKSIQSLKVLPFFRLYAPCFPLSHPCLSVPIRG
jgi:hypothetical protein